MDNYIDDLAIIKQQLLGNNAACFLGKSYGAMCALVYALRYPKDVRHLILAAGAPGHQFLEKAKSNIASIGTAEQKNICLPLWDGAFKDDVHLAEYLKVTGPQPTKDEIDALITLGRDSNKSHSPLFKTLGLTMIILGSIITVALGIILSIGTVGIATPLGIGLTIGAITSGVSALAGVGFFTYGHSHIEISHDVEYLSSLIQPSNC